MWNQRSCALWIKCGDRNTKFFHATANQRLKKNKIEGLWDSKGVWQEKQEKVESVILKYFSTIFSIDLVNFEASLGAMSTWVSTKMNNELLRDFKEEEVWNALK